MYRYRPVPHPVHRQLVFGQLYKLSRLLRALEPNGRDRAQRVVHHVGAGRDGNARHLQLAETGSTSVLAAEVASDAAAVQQPLTVAGSDGESPPGVGNGKQSAVVTADAPLAYISAATMMAVRQTLRARALHTLPASAECTHI